MVAVNLKPRVPEDIDGVTLDPQPDWSFDALLLELSSIERKVAASPKFPAYTKICSRDRSASKRGALRQGFVMRVTETLSDCEDEVSEQSVTPGMHITCDDLYASDGQISEDEASIEVDQHLMEKVGLVEGALSELTYEHRLNVMENVRNKISELETALLDEHHIFSSKLQFVAKDSEALSEMDRRLGLQYQRKIAEALDDHLISVQRDHEHRSQLEERRIRDDAAREEAKRREKGFLEEKAMLEKIRTEPEVQPKVIEAVGMKKEKTAELEAQRKDVEEAAEENSSENVKNIATGHHKVSEQTAEFGQDVHNSSQSAGLKNSGFEDSVGKVVKLDILGHNIKAAKNALDLEKERSMLYKELVAKNEALGLGTKREYDRHDKEISRRIKTITGSGKNVRAKADELIKLINYSPYPQSISIAILAKEIVCRFVALPPGGFKSIPYSFGLVIVLVTSQVPLAMDIILAELNKNCIYTVPKHIVYSQSYFKTKKAYCKAIGYQDGEIETDSSYLHRLCAFMKLYGAIVQTEVEGFQNMHGHREGWAWLARLLNAVPANLYTAAALKAFLEVAGFVLHRKYKHHFEKLLNILTRDFLKALDEGLQSHIVVTELRSYVESKRYLSEPEGRHLTDHLLSNTCI
ncbi:unnamed protein product [Cuscuta epithymum]|uniref:mRNA export factor GLE1 n=1 Tax=Cuscuta epithymum TaxID=186058 RepID=A0AAV0CRH2_9ASTE|nr:unnamed protein product [Cuscuta epithymum]